MIRKFVTILQRVHHELPDLNHTSRINKLVSLKIPKFATELAAGTDANFGIGTLEALGLLVRLLSPNCLECLLQIGRQFGDGALEFGSTLVKQ
jgi:hypothetical protein